MPKKHRDLLAIRLKDPEFKKAYEAAIARVDRMQLEAYDRINEINITVERLMREQCQNTLSEKPSPEKK